MGRIANFIDAAYLMNVTKEEFASARLDLGLLAAKMAGGRDLLRTYYYDCLPYQSPQPKIEEQQRFGKRQRFHAKLNQLSRFEVRLGRLEYRG